MENENEKEQEQKWSPPPKTSINILDIVVLSPKHVVVDGIVVGNLVDAIANMPQFSAKFQIALEDAWDRATNSGK